MKDGAEWLSSVIACGIVHNKVRHKQIIKGRVQLGMKHAIRPSNYPLWRTCVVQMTRVIVSRATGQLARELNTHRFGEIGNLFMTPHIVLHFRNLMGRWRWGEGEGGVDFFTDRDP